MKKTLLFGWAAVAAALLAGACNRMPEPATETQTGKVTLKAQLDGKAVQTRGADVGNYNRETAILDMQLLVFDTNGHLEYYASTDEEDGEFVFSLRAGTMKAWVVANGPELNNITTETAMAGMMLDLGTYNNPSDAFVMAGSETIQVVSGEFSDCIVELSRLVSRVTLKSVTSRLPEAYGTVTVDYAMLENVVSSYSIGGAAGTTGWYNPMGRKTESPLVQSHIVNPPTYVADHAELTFHTLTGSTGFDRGDSYTTPQRFYAYPNATALDHSGFATPFTARYTRLVLKATIDGGTYYYPISIPNLTRNTCYDIKVTLAGLGSSDPDVPVQKGEFDVAISVADWGDGGEITETI